MFETTFEDTSYDQGASTAITSHQSQAIQEGKQGWAEAHGKGSGRPN